MIGTNIETCLGLNFKKLAHLVGQGFGSETRPPRMYICIYIRAGLVSGLASSNLFHLSASLVSLFVMGGADLTHNYFFQVGFRQNMSDIFCLIIFGVG